MPACSSRSNGAFFQPFFKAIPTSLDYLRRAAEQKMVRASWNSSARNQVFCLKWAASSELPHVSCFMWAAIRGEEIRRWWAFNCALHLQNRLLSGNRAAAATNTLRIPGPRGSLTFSTAAHPSRLCVCAVSLQPATTRRSTWTSWSSLAGFFLAACSNPRGDLFSYDSYDSPFVCCRTVCRIVCPDAHCVCPLIAIDRHRSPSGPALDGLHFSSVSVRI